MMSKDPDVFALYEVLGKDVFNALMTKMPNHTFTITENNRQNDMEILVGVRRSIQAFVTQREEFRSKVPTLRPGALATLKVGGAFYSLLFLHVKSFDDPRSWGLRDDMFGHAASLKRTLDKTAPGAERANFLCLGDLNTMGLNAPYNNICELDADLELTFVDKRFKSVKMRRLPKTHEASWWNGKDHWEPSKLDHVFAADHLKLKKIGASEIEVVGWPTLSTTAQKKTWIDQHSDHALLFGTVMS